MFMHLLLSNNISFNFDFVNKNITLDATKIKTEIITLHYYSCNQNGQTFTVQSNLRSIRSNLMRNF